MTARAIDADGWLHTDLRCTVDPDGDFLIAGHLGDIAGQGVLP